jgi:hypothetical protein
MALALESEEAHLFEPVQPVTHAHVCHDVHENAGTYTKSEGMGQNCMPLIIKDLSKCCWPGCKKKGESKNEEQTQDVIENKRRKDFDMRACHDVYEKKCLISMMPRYL